MNIKRIFTEPNDEDQKLLNCNGTKICQPEENETRESNFMVDNSGDNENQIIIHIGEQLNGYFELKYQCEKKGDFQRTCIKKIRSCFECFFMFLFFSWFYYSLRYH
ncbi:hypothetical protein EDEG_01790 [Edhazardia aedis USNM 41457]|uniref:Uncharacterized protein n=1 Tax=Edhazardia aedis (strain USNM 41457) TaxID=1003232 RepID=J9DRE7_EDHAE|nr:hypothetical protein EDEG_01790 [Edhazardia aedis USNM 41457]|eukprot:EJW03912.1 hypothetical protein EDEG_01790 [Edhazardia aedis USNM 41457]